MRVFLPRAGLGPAGFFFAFSFEEKKKKKKITAYRFESFYALGIVE
jgi:hypothetical protein